MARIEGVLELRPPGVMGRWEERWFSLDDVSLTHWRMLGERRDDSTQDGFPLEQIENLTQDGNELSFTVGGRKSRFRGKPGASLSIDQWLQSLMSAVARAKESSDLLPSDSQSQFSPALDLSRSQSSPVGKSPQKSDSSLSSAALKNRNRIEMLYDSHQKKLERLEHMRTQEEVAERKRLEKEFEAIKSHTRRPSRTPIAAKDVAKTANRLFNEHRYMQQRLDEKRVRHEEQERERIEHNKYRSRPTRSQSDPSLVDAREAGLRLYSDAERRGQWKQLAKDAQAKEELSMVTIGTTKGHSTASAVMRCVELYRESNARKDKLEKARLLKQKEEKKRMDEDSVPCGKGRRGPDLGRINLLFAEYQERQQKLTKKKADQLAQEMKTLVTVPRARIPVSVSLGARKLPPWKDKEFPWNLMTKKKDEPESPATDSSVRSIPQTTQADYALLAITTHIGLRSGFNQYNIRPVDQQKLVLLLKNAMTVYKNALDQISQDPGYANMCNRSSQRLFQEHLLPEVEGWSHRLEPDAVRQVEDDLDALLDCAARAQEQLKDKVAPGVPWSPGQMKQHPAGVPTALWAYDPGVKERKSAETKAMVRFGPGEGPQRYRHLVDLSRLGLVFASCDMLQVGLDHILRRFEVVDVRNHFASPGLIGRRYVEVLVVEKVPDGRDELPHVCELRLEPQVYHNANRAADEHLKEFYTCLRKVYENAHMTLDAVEAIAHRILDKAPEGHRLRAFRCHLARRFGSPVCGWRRALGGGRMLSFQRLRDVCYSLHCGEHVTELWEELDPGRGGCISLWELDPDSCALLTKLRTRLMENLEAGTGNSVPGSATEMDPSSIFQKLAAWIKPVTQGQLELHEFRAISRPFGFSQQESDKLFSALDQFGGSEHAPPATINASDFVWLKKLPTLIDTDAVACAQEPGYTMTDELKSITLTPRHSGIFSARQISRPALEDGSGTSPGSVGSHNSSPRFSGSSPRLSGSGGVLKAWVSAGGSPKRHSDTGTRSESRELRRPSERTASGQNGQLPRSTSAPPKALTSSGSTPRSSLAATAPARVDPAPAQVPSSGAREDTVKAQADGQSVLKPALKSNLKEPPAPAPQLESPADQSTNLGDLGVDIEDEEEYYEEEGEEEEGEFEEDLEEEEEDPDGDGDDLLPDNEETW